MGPGGGRIRRPLCQRIMHEFAEGRQCLKIHTWAVMNADLSRVQLLRNEGIEVTQEGLGQYKFLIAASVLIKIRKRHP